MFAWSLSVDEQFYLIWAGVLHVLRGTAGDFDVFPRIDQGSQFQGEGFGNGCHLCKNHQAQIPLPLK